MALQYLTGEYGVFVKTTAPTDKWDDTEYTETLYATQIGFPISNEMLDITNLNSPGTVRKFAEFLTGTMNMQFTMQGYWDAAEETGQELVFQAGFNTSTTAGTKLWLLLTTTIAGLKEIACEVRIAQAQNAGQVGQVPTFSWTLQVTGLWYEQAGA